MNRFVYALFIFVLSVVPSSSFCNVQVCDADLDVYTSTALELYAIKHKLNLKNHIAEIAQKLYGKKEAEDLLNVEQFMRQTCKNSLELKDNPLKFYSKVLKDFSPEQDSEKPLTRSEKASKYAGATYRAVTESTALHKALKVGKIIGTVCLVLCVIALAQEVAGLNRKMEAVAFGMNYNTRLFAQNLDRIKTDMEKAAVGIDQNTTQFAAQLEKHDQAIRAISTISLQTSQQMNTPSRTSRFFDFLTNMLLVSWLTNSQGSGGGEQGEAPALATL